MSNKRKSLTSNRYVDPGVVIVDPMNYTNYEEPEFVEPEGYRAPFLYRNFHRLPSRLHTMVDNYQRGDMTKREALNEVFKSINARRKRFPKYSEAYFEHAEALRALPSEEQERRIEKFVNRIKKNKNVENKGKIVKKSKTMAKIPWSTARKEAHYQRRVGADIQKFARLIALDKQSGNKKKKALTRKYDWCTQFANSIRDAMREGIKSEEEIKAMRKAKVSYQKLITGKPNPRMKKTKVAKARKELTPEQAARVAKMQAGLNAWRQLSKDEQKARTNQKKEKKREAAERRAMGMGDERRIARGVGRKKRSVQFA